MLLVLPSSPKGHERPWRASVALNTLASSWLVLLGFDPPACGTQSVEAVPRSLLDGIYPAGLLEALELKDTLRCSLSPSPLPCRTPPHSRLDPNA